LWEEPQPTINPERSQKLKTSILLSRREIVVYVGVFTTIHREKRKSGKKAMLLAQLISLWQLVPPERKAEPNQKTKPNQHIKPTKKL
jgi:hypothetical protein